MADVFISYNRRDIALARHIADALHQYVYDLWVDWADLHVAAGWEAEIYKGIEKSNCFVCLISSNFMTSEMCQKELAAAIQLKKRIIPVRIGLVDEIGIFHSEIRTGIYQKSWESLAPDNWRFISGLKYLVYPKMENEFNDFIKQLGEVIQSDLEYLRKHTYYWQSAKNWDIRQRPAELLLRGEELQEASVWLEASLNKEASATKLHEQYITESQQQAARHSSLIKQALYRFTYQLFRLGPHKIFISYRRADTAYACGWMYDQLQNTFGQKNIFLDVDSIEFGTDFSQFIQKTLTECFVVLVVIGPQWLPILKERDKSIEVDFVRTEVELALKRKHINVIPLLVDGAQMPLSYDLPASMQDLPLKNGKSLGTGRVFHQDMSVLIKELKKLRSQVRVDNYR